MKKLLSFFLAAALLLSLLSGCGGPPEEGGTPQPHAAADPIAMSNPDGDTWTVLVYLCGTDLETDGGFASINLQEIAAATQSEKVNILVETGGTQQWQIDGISSGELQRWKVVPEDIELVESQPLADMGKAETLGDFLAWGVKAYPADKYIALLWDHGGGSVAGIAADQLHNGDMLDLKELAQGISMAGQQFELVGFDACLMSTLETAAALTPYARYMVASQELEPGTGWDYTDWLSYVAENPTVTGLEVGSRICDGFYKKCAVSGSEGLATLSVTDLSQLPNLAAAFDAMAAEMKGFTAEPSKLQPLTQAITRAENYGGNNDAEGYTNMVDLGDLAVCAEGILPETGAAVLSALEKAVPHTVAGAGRQRGHGLSVYVPLSIAEGELDNYAKLAAISGEYLRFIEGLYNWTVPSGVTLKAPVYPTGAGAPVEEDVAVDDVAAAESLEPKDYAVEFSTRLLDDGTIELDVTGGANVIRTVAFNLYYQDEETHSLWYLGTDFDVNEAEAGVDDSGDTARFWDNCRNTWTIINDNLCMMVALSFTDDYILYTVPVQVNGEPTNLRMLYHRDRDEYEVLGTWDGIDAETGMSSRDVKKLKDGDVVDFVFDAADLKTGEDASFVGGGFTVSGPVVAEEATLFDGTYYYEYEITDIFGNTYTSDFAIITVVNGEMTVSIET